LAGLPHRIRRENPAAGLSTRNPVNVKKISARFFCVKKNGAIFQEKISDKKVHNWIRFFLFRIYPQ
jgi:hypothetical protein